MPTALLLWTAWGMSAAGIDPSTDTAHFEFRTQAMSILLGWSILNLLGGGLGAVAARPISWRVFLGANAAWNIVNLAIALAGYFSAKAYEPGSLEGVAFLREVVFFQKILLVNVGLDAGYIAAGVLTVLWGRDRDDPWRLSIGLALVLQGLFLLVFDIALSSMVNGQLDALWASLES